MAIAAIMALATSGTDEGLQRFAFSQVHMGGRVDITLYASDQEEAETAAKAAFAKYAELEDVFSDYRPASELMQLCAKAGSGPVKVSGDLFEVLWFAQEISQWSNAAFDVSASPVIRLWRTARQTSKMPDEASLNDALSKVGFRNIELDPLHKTVNLKTKGMQLDLGGIAKGYTNDQALKELKANGVERAMVEAGGDIGFSGPPPGHQGWAVRIRGLGDTFLLHDCAMSTSGDTEQFVEIGGNRYSHVVDPRTGYGVTSRVQATVIAPHGLTTDPLATALCVDPTLKDFIPKMKGVTTLVTVVN